MKLPSFILQRSVNSLAISPDSRWVVSGSIDKSVRIWDTRNAAAQCILRDVHDEVNTVDFSPVGGYLASGGKGGAVRIWRYSCISPGGGHLHD
jgi:WD40 repeat protein